MSTSASLVGLASDRAARRHRAFVGIRNWPLACIIGIIRPCLCQSGSTYDTVEGTVGNSGDTGSMFVSHTIISHSLLLVVPVMSAIGRSRVIHIRGIAHTDYISLLMTESPR